MRNHKDDGEKKLARGDLHCRASTLTAARPYDDLFVRKMCLLRNWNKTLVDFVPLPREMGRRVRESWSTLFSSNRLAGRFSHACT